MADYAATLTNCVFYGTETGEIETDGKLLRGLVKMPFRAAGFDFELFQNPNFVRERNKLRGTIKTSILYARNVAQADTPKVEEAIDHICDLLSFATESRVSATWKEYPAGSGFGSGRGALGTIQTWRPPFQDSANIKRFLETCYDDFVALRDVRMLHVVIDYIHHSIMHGLAEEVKIGLACIAFENLRDSWARADGYPHLGGFFREKHATAANMGATVGIQRHLKEMFSAVGMTSDPKRIVDTRNEVIHTGLYGNLGNSDIHEFLETALREYFLRLVGYKGDFMPYIGGGPAPITIT